MGEVQTQIKAAFDAAANSIDIASRVRLSFDHDGNRLRLVCDGTVPRLEAEKRRNAWRWVLLILTSVDDD